LVAAQQRNACCSVAADHKRNVAAAGPLQHGNRAVVRTVQRLAPIGVAAGAFDSAADDADSLKAAADEGCAPRRLGVLDSAAADGPPPLQDLRLVALAGYFARADVLARLGDPRQIGRAHDDPLPRSLG
jgi:hypothetical protein